MNFTKLSTSCNESCKQCWSKHSW